MDSRGSPGFIVFKLFERPAACGFGGRGARAPLKAPFTHQRTFIESKIFQKTFKAMRKLRIWICNTQHPPYFPRNLPAHFKIYKSTLFPNNPTNCLANRSPKNSRTSSPKPAPLAFKSRYATAATPYQDSKNPSPKKVWQSTLNNPEKTKPVPQTTKKRQKNQGNFSSYHFTSLRFTPPWPSVRPPASSPPPLDASSLRGLSPRASSVREAAWGCCSW